LTSYKIASEEGAQRYAGELGQEVELELDEDQERAVIAAGWVEPAEKAKKQGVTDGN
jgi:hypothetical protein